MNNFSTSTITGCKINLCNLVLIIDCEGERFDASCAGRQMPIGGDYRVVRGRSHLLERHRRLGAGMSGITDRLGGERAGQSNHLELSPLHRQAIAAAAGLSVDERSALCLLALARDLLAADHHAVAMMIDYAMVDVARRPAD